MSISWMGLLIGGVGGLLLTGLVGYLVWRQVHKAVTPVVAVVLPSPKKQAVVRGGWVSVSLNALLELEGVQSSLKVIRATEQDWVGDCDDAWFQELLPRSRAVMLALSLELHANKTKDPLDVVQFKRFVTASSILFGTSVPIGLWQMDRFVMQKVLRYLALCEKVEHDPVMATTDPLVVTDRFEELVECLSTRSVVIATVSSAQRPLNFVCLRRALFQDLQIKALCQHNPLVLKKALSCVYLIAGLSVPRDCLYVDMEVKNYVLRLGQYVPVKKSHLSVVRA